VDGVGEAIFGSRPRPPGTWTWPVLQAIVIQFRGVPAGIDPPKAADPAVLSYQGHTASGRLVARACYIEFGDGDGKPRGSDRQLSQLRTGQPAR
jgi:hypothetical protein